MKKTDKYIIINLGVFPFDIMVSVDEPDDVLFKRLWGFGIDKKECAESLIMPNITNGRCVMFENGVTVIRLKKREKYAMIGTISHEAFHAASFILEHASVEMKMGISDEVYAYMSGYITSEICRYFKI